jgi:hypothetical protein
MRDPIFAHLRSGAREVADWVKREPIGSVAEAMFSRPPTASPSPSNNPFRENLLRNLRELNARIDAKRGR